MYPPLLPTKGAMARGSIARVARSSPYLPPCTNLQVQLQIRDLHKSFALALLTNRRFVYEQSDYKASLCNRFASRTNLRFVPAALRTPSSPKVTQGQGEVVDLSASLTNRRFVYVLLFPLRGIVLFVKALTKGMCNYNCSCMGAAKLYKATICKA